MDAHATPRYRKAPAWTLVAMVIALFAWATKGTIRRVLADGRLDFYHFYEAAVAVANGKDIYLSGSEGYIYPPLLAVLFVPLAPLGHDAGVFVWLGINIAFIVLVLIAGFRTLATRFEVTADRYTIACVASLSALLSLEQIRWQLILGQTDTLTLVGCTLALLWLDRRPLLAGALLGGVSNIKYQTVLLLPYLLVRGRMRAALGLVGGAILAGLLPALVFGWQRNLEYLGVAFGGMLGLVGIDVVRAAKVPELLWERSITVTSGFARIADHFCLKPELALPAVGVLALAILGVVALLYRRQEIPLLLHRGGKRERESPFPAVTAIEWCGMLVALCIFSPQGTKRHLFLLLLVNLTTVFLLWNARVPSTRWILLAGIAVSQLALHLPPSRSFKEAADAWKFIGGPSWGILVLCLALVQAGLQEARWLARKSAPGDA
jgi:hypothetical protein